MILFFLACAAQADEMIADEPPAEIVELNDTEIRTSGRPRQRTDHG